jgi:PAP2 superfamily protein
LPDSCFSGSRVFVRYIFYVLPLPLPSLTPTPQPATAVAGDPADRLPARFSGGVWLATGGAFVFAYGLLFTVVHPYVDTRKCVAQLPDPLFALIPYAHGWYRISHELFYVVTAICLAVLMRQTARGEHRALVRFAAGISVQAVLRAITLVLLPLCRATVAPGTAALDAVPTIDLGFMHLPWRTWATNDLVFSGHVGEFLILSLAVRPFWPGRARLALGAFQVLQAVALVATRGHYTVDIVIAIPFAFFADRLTVAALARWTARRPPLVSA